MYRSVQGHIAPWCLCEGPDMLRMCGSQFSCLCNSSALFYVCFGMSSPSAGSSSGVSLYPLYYSSSLFAGKQQRLSSCLSIFLLRKHRCPFSLSVSVYLCPQLQRPEIDIKRLSRLIFHDHPNQLQNALWHFYCCQSTADVTNVFQSGAIMTIKVSSGTRDEPLTTRLRPVSDTNAPGASSLLDEVIVLSRWASELTSWRVAAAWSG